MEKDENELNRSYIESLPNEILIKILQNLNTIDLISFCTSFPEYICFLHEKAVIRLADFSNRNEVARPPYNIKVINMLKIEYITMLNVSYVYWVQAVDLRRILKKMINLKELHIIGTKVHMSEIDCESYKSDKLKKLAVTVVYQNIKNCEVARFFPNLQNICIQIISKECRKFQYWLEGLINGLKHLEKLWIHDTTNSCPLNFNHLYNGSSWKTFAFKATCSFFYSLESTFKGLTKIAYKGQPGIEGYFEQVNENAILNPMALGKSTAWKILNELHSEPPYGLNDAKKLMHDQVDINEIFFEELSFKHGSNICCDRYVKAMKDIINSENASKLRKLCVNNCLSNDNNLDTKAILPTSSSCNESDEYHPMKKTKLEDEIEMKCDLNYENLADLEEMEIYVCSKYTGFEIYHSLPRLKNLTKLSLEIPCSLNGAFLKEVFESCEMLDTLKINVVASNENFNRDFCRYIKYAKNLKNLRYKHYTVYFENFFYGLAEMKIPTIQSISLKCTDIQKYGVASMDRFFKQNPQLQFVVIILGNATAVWLKLLNNHMRLFNKDNMTKTFIAKNSNDNISNINPEFCRSEVMSSRSNVATLDIYDEFCYS